MDPVTRRDELMRAAARAYEAAHGNPIAEPVRGFRWQVSRRVATTVLIVVAIGLVAIALSTRPQPATLGEPAQSPPASVGAATTQAATLTVHVTGAVAHEGVYSLPAGSRVEDAVDAAGGAAADAQLSGLNLARHLQDGEQVLVPRVGEAAAASSGVNLNSADAGKLEELPGIGPVLADRIVSDRAAHGPFLRVEDLSRVSGVGPAILAQLEGLVTV